MTNPISNHKYPFEFHVAKHIREKYELDSSFFASDGNVIFANFYQVRLFVQKINNKRDKNNHVSPGEINGAGLLDEIYHIAIKNYIKSIFPNVLTTAINFLGEKIGANKLESLLLEFVKVFPPQKVYSGEQTEKEYLNSYTGETSNKEIALEELLLLHFSNKNPAFNKIKELFDENYLEGKKVYNSTILSLREFFKKEEYTLGISNTDLFDFLSMPFIKHSNSIWDQLEFIKNEWGIFIDHKLLLKIQSSKDLFIESITFEPQFGGGGAAPTVVPKYKGQLADSEHFVIGKSKFKYAEESAKEYEEPEQFTPDTNWMPNLVLIAKNTYVWLDQLSKKYQREIRTLDQIPIEELEELKRFNINGLWLIGVWERSSASKKIKHLMGNIDAVASAYSLYDYQIAADLGGEYAYNIFNERAKQVGIRLASDMVPNHTGIYSKWVIEKPDYFIQLDYPPFPNYSFTGENLSEHPDVEIRIEDQYWDMKDAAVVFERKNIRTGERKYIYHGNDGTNMPWNDTAQLNLLKHEVREALIQKIFDVARKFSVIRFDAAMTLAKKHYARLWFPEPGKGGDIPSRSDHALTRRQFDELFPKEFWREVVDRINTEMPETLLLAEAFWLMEGYFVRTLGMHRVYNSAFMNMMMNEENAKYRELITNTLEFEPEILKRYVNFMSNPDEETAIDQFGSGDKYFGVLVLMCTLPGLPMFAHGQIEGYKEKYGMEYQRAYYDEKPIDWLVERHKREIFPLLRKRYIFSEVKNYWIYDFIDEHGNVNENVFVYSNSFNDETGLVIFNNSFSTTNGHFYYSRQKLNGNSSNGAALTNINIGKCLNIKHSDFHFYIFKDITTGLEYFLNGSEINKQGLKLHLAGYEFRVFLKTKEIFDPTGNAYKLYSENYGKGISNVELELDKLKLKSLHEAFINLHGEEFVNTLNKLINAKKISQNELAIFQKNYLDNYHNLIEELIKRGELGNKKKIKKLSLIEFVHLLNGLSNSLVKGKTSTDLKLKEILFAQNSTKWLVILLSGTVSELYEQIREQKNEDKSLTDLMLTIPIESIMSKYFSDDKIAYIIVLINILLYLEEEELNIKEVPDEFLKLRSPKKIFEFVNLNFNSELKNIIELDLVKNLIQVNNFEGINYFSKEKFEELIDYLTTFFISGYALAISNTKISRIKKTNNILRFARKVLSLNQYLKKEAADSKYQYEVLVEKFTID